MKPEKFVEELTLIFKKNANPNNAIAMSNYMKNLFSFYGIKKPLRMEITKSLFIKVKEENLEAKIKGMESYELERRQFPHPRSPEALRIQAQRWGIVIGEGFAEAFSIVRIVA